MHPQDRGQNARRGERLEHKTRIEDVPAVGRCPQFSTTHDATRSGIELLLVAAQRGGRELAVLKSAVRR